jgi:predicted ester cyclase
VSTEQNKAIAQRIYDEVINQEKRAVIDEVFAPGVVIHDPFMGAITGIEAFRQLLGMFDAAFPGHRVQVEAVIAEGEYVTVLHTHTATHSGPFMGMPPTGKQIVVNGVELYRMANGQIVEFWRKDDDVSLLMQLGALPPPQPA